MSILIAWCTAFWIGLGLHRATVCSTAVEANPRPENLPVIVEGNVHLSNDGPTILESNITFYARLVDVDGHYLESGEYDFVWGEIGYFKWTDESNTTSNFTWKYSAEKAIREHTVTLTVLDRSSQQILDEYQYAKNKTSFNVTGTINGQLDFSEVNATNLNTDTFESNQLLQITASIYDPSNYLEYAEIIYNWDVRNVYQTVTVNEPSISHNFTLPDEYEIDVNITAYVTEDGINFKKKLGYFTSVVHIRDKVSNLRVTGSSVVTVGDTHQYQITCNASLPAYMCSHLSSNSTCVDALHGCVPIELKDNCSSVIKLHFNASGTHCLSMNVSNDVSNSGVTTNIKVNQVDQKAISITFGVLFGVVCCIISIYLVAQQVKKSRRRHIEVANFDFQESEHNSTFHIFTQNVKNTYKAVSSKISLRTKKRTEYSPLIPVEENADT